MGFICLNLPFAIKTIFHRQFAERYKILDLYHSNDLFTTTTTKSEIDAAVKFEFFSMLTHLLLDLNYIANFFLYFFSGSRFRAQLFSMLCMSCDDEKQKSISRYRNHSQNSKSLKLNENKPAKKSYNPVVYIKYSLVKKNDRGVCDNEPTVCIGSRRPSSNISGAAIDAKRLSVQQLKNGAKTAKNSQSAL